MPPPNGSEHDKVVHNSRVSREDSLSLDSTSNRAHKIMWARQKSSGCTSSHDDIGEPQA